MKLSIEKPSRAISKTGRRPKRSLKPPKMGAHTNCITANVVSKRPAMVAPSLIERPATSSRSAGIRGMIKPKPTASRKIMPHTNSNTRPFDGRSCIFSPPIRCNDASDFGLFILLLRTLNQVRSVFELTINSACGFGATVRMLVCRVPLRRPY